MNKQFFINNRNRLAGSLEDGSFAILFAGKAPRKSADEYYEFTPNRNFYYLTGISIEKAIFLMSKNNGAVKFNLFIEKPDNFREKWTGKMMDKDEALSISGIEDIIYMDSFMGTVKASIMGGCGNLYLDLEHFDDFDMPLSPVQAYARDIRDRFPYVNIKNIHDKISDLRVIKSDDEIENIKKAIEITKEGIMAMMENAKPGMMEYELEAYFDHTLKSRGVKSPAFKTIAASGVNGAVLHYSRNNSRSGENDLILLDLGAEYSYYAADISRTFPLNGKFTKRQREVYDVVLEALVETTKAVKPGLPFKNLNEITKGILTEGLKKLGLIKEDSELSKYYYHGVSHYLGLDTHDVGSRDRDLAPGMVITMEPGLYIEEEGIGVRIEDDVLVTKGGYEVLSKDIIRTAEEIEEFMKR